jgi:hypothetical protein
MASHLRSSALDGRTATRCIVAHAAPAFASASMPMPLTVGVDWMLVSLPEPESRQPIFVIRNCRM